MLSRRRFCLELLAGLWLVAGSRGAFAESGPGSDGSGGGNDGGGDDHGGDKDADDQDQARKAVIRGDATALRDILRQVRRQYSGEIVHVGLNQRLDGLDYMIKLIDPEGKLLLLRVDAKSGAVLAVRGE